MSLIFQRMKYLRLLLIILALTVFPSGAFSQGQKHILIGVVPEINIFKQKARYSELANYLSQKTGLNVKITVISKYGSIIKSFERDRMDGAFLGSFTGVQAIEKLGVEPLARPVDPDNSSTYQGYIFVRKDSGIKSARDMKNKTMAFVEKATTAGYVFPLAYLKENGVRDIDSFFKDYFFTGSHDAAISAVLTGKADIGAAKHSIYEGIKRENPLIEKELVVLAESAMVPSNALCVRRGLSPEVRQKLKGTLIGMDSDPEGRKVLEKFGALRFIETTVRDFQPVYDLAKKAGIELRK